MTVWKNTATLAETTCALVADLLNGSTPATDATYNNQVIDVPSVEQAVTVVDQSNLADLIAAGSFSQSDIDAAQ